MTDLVDRNSRAYSKDEPPLDGNAIRQLVAELDPDWTVGHGNTTLSRTFSFDNYYETIAFVNGVALIANQQDHHPDLQVSYNRCVVTFSTHSIGGLSENDFICAAKVDRLPAL
jgi:4a-hydroxytetrahydrobiopterin dehydratase